MSEMLKKYEISVWEDELVTPEDGESYYRERKIAIIGGDDFPAPQKVYDPVLTENVNGEKTLTFTLQHYYFDEKVGDYVTNPIYPLLVNERKVKLYYNDKWYDFIIKECQEDSENQTFSYTATDIFINELSKQGYNVEFATELNNNLGTIVELGVETIKGTDWIIDEDDCDLLQQTVQEPLYEATAARGFSALNLDTGEMDPIEQGEELYVFYSYVSTEDFTNVQFLRKRDEESKSWKYDDNEVIVGTNYRYEGDGAELFNIGNPYYNNQAYRLVYQPRAVYDPVMDQYVDVYRANYTDGTQDIYKVVTTEYNTSSVVTSVVTNGNDFAIVDNAKVTGWDDFVAFTGDEKPEAKLYSYPIIDTNTKLASLKEMNQLSSYLKVSTHVPIISDSTGYKNLVFNRGFMDYGGRIDSISKGEEYAFRMRIGKINANGQPIKDTNYSNVKVYVAYYKTVKQDVEGTSTDVKTFTDNDIIFEFKTPFDYSLNKITGGELNTNKTVYTIDNIPQTPSLKYIYVNIEKQNNQEVEKNYIWNPNNSTYVSYSVSNPNWFLDTYITTANAKVTVTNEKLTDPTIHIGIFIGTTDGVDRYFGDVEIFKVLRDTENHIILPGNAPSTLITNRELYYLKPENSTQVSSMNTYSSLEDIASDLGIEPDLIQQVYNENCEKILSIEESKSNIFNILQTLCETFECWLKITVEHERNGAIKLDKNHKPIKKISFKEYVGKENSAGFKYGINLNSISRTIDSNEVVTKLIVAETASDYAENGTLSIAYADSNPLKESVIYNLDYYVQKGLIKDKEQYNTDLNELYEQVGPINEEIQQLSSDLALANNALINVKSQANVYAETITTARDKYNEALIDFEEIAGISYAKFTGKEFDDEEKAETLMETVGALYAAQSLLNNVSGPETSANEEYKRLQLLINGVPEYSITVSTTKPETQDTQDNDASTTYKAKVLVSDYIEGLKFTLKSGSNEKTFTTSLNDKEFEFLTNSPCTYLIVENVPTNYLFEYTNIDTGKKDKVTTVHLKIYNEAADEGMVRKFALVPTETAQAQYKGYQDQIDEKIAEKQALINDFERKYRQYIQEGTWEETSYIDSNLYYFDALQVAHTSAKPQITYTINVTEVSAIEGLEGYTFAIGDKTYVEDTEFFGWTVDEVPVGNDIVEIYTPVQEEVILSEIEWHLDDPSANTITVQNYKTQFEDLFQRISATVQSVQYNESSYSRAAKILDKNGTINKDLLSKSLSGLVGNAYPISPYIKIDDTGIIAQDQQAQSNLVKLAGSGIYASVDGGKSWKNIINANGITTDSLTAGTINTQNIQIMDGNNTSFRWDQAGLNAYGGDGTEGYDLTSFVRMDRFGIYGVKHGEDENGNPIYIYDELNKVIDAAHFSLTWDGFRIKNSYTNGYVSLTSDNDFEVIRLLPSAGRSLRSSNLVPVTKIKIGALEKDSKGVPTKYGINIYNDSGESVFTTNDDGNIAITGRINATGGDFSGNIQVGSEDQFIMIDAESEQPAIFSSNYLHNTSTGWIIDASGDAIFNNVSVRGAIKTAVFEYSEIEAVGGAFLFRPSSTINEVFFDEDDLVVLVKQPELFRLYEWVKLSNANASIDNGGLSHIYKIKGTTDLNGLILENAGLYFEKPQIEEQEQEETELQPITFTKEENTSWYTATYDLTLIENHAYVFSFTDVAYRDTPVLIDDQLTLISENYVITNYNESTPTTNIRAYLPDLYEIYDISPNDNPAALGLYEYDVLTDTYILTEDTTPVSYKVYCYIPEEVVLEFSVSDDTYPSSSIDDLIGGAIISFGYDNETADEVEVESGDNPSALNLYDQKTKIIFNNSPNFSRQASSHICFFDNKGNFHNRIEIAKGAINSSIYYDVIRVYRTDTGWAQNYYKEIILDEDWSKLSVNLQNELLNNATIINTYVPTTDVTPGYSIFKGDRFLEEGMGTYYERSGDGTVSNPYVYTVTSDEVINPNKTYYLYNENKKYYKSYAGKGGHNYGIGINSSDNYVGLPERAISLFETSINPRATIKVSYDYKGILGTLPRLGTDLVRGSLYNTYMSGTQGIFTNNMYIGDKNQYLAFYTGSDGQKHLEINAKDLIYEIDDDGEITTWTDVIDSSLTVLVSSTMGTQITDPYSEGLLFAKVYSGDKEIDEIPDELEFGTLDDFKNIHYTLIENPDTGANPHDNGWYEKNENDEYILTEDITIQDGKQYYEKYERIPEDGDFFVFIEEVNVSYAQITNPDLTANPKAKGWYELINGEFVLTTDEIIQIGKTYYNKDFDLKAVPKRYTVLAREVITNIDPEDNPQEEGWYELINEEYVLTEDTVVNIEKTYYGDITSIDWVEVTFDYKYEWTYNNQTNISFSNNKIIYFTEEMINGKLTAEVTVSEKEE